MASTQTIARISEEYLTLVNLVQETPPGTLLDYAQVEDATGVPMGIGMPGRSMLRRAILRTGREYSVIRGVGFVTASKDNAMGILVHQLGGIDRKVKRADRATRVVRDAFIDEMPEPQQKAVMFLGSVFGAIRMAAENGRRLYGVQSPHANVGAGIIPVPRDS